MATKKKAPRPSARALAKATGVPERLILRIRRGEVGMESAEFQRYFDALVNGLGKQITATEQRLRSVEQTFAALKRKR